MELCNRRLLRLKEFPASEIPPKLWFIHFDVESPKPCNGHFPIPLHSLFQQFKDRIHKLFGVSSVKPVFFCQPVNDLLFNHMPLSIGLLVFFLLPGKGGNCLVVKHLTCNRSRSAYI